MSQQLFLFPGNFAASDEPARITTLLGSCVAVALHDPVSRVGGVNHYLLAEPLSPSEKPSGRHGSYAIPALIESLVRLGADPTRLQAKVYGGANVMSELEIGRNVGQANIAMAKRLLAAAKIPVIEEDTGGERGRKICLSTETFEVTCRTLTRTDSEGGRASGQTSGVASGVKK